MIASKLIQKLINICPVPSKNWLKTPKMIAENLSSVQQKTKSVVLMKMYGGLWDYSTSPPSLLPSNNDGLFSIWDTHLHLHHHQDLLPSHEMCRKPFCCQNKLTNFERQHKNHKQLVVKDCIAMYWLADLGVSLSCHFCNGSHSLMSLWLFLFCLSVIFLSLKYCSFFLFLLCTKMYTDVSHFVQDMGSYRHHTNWNRTKKTCFPHKKQWIIEGWGFGPKTSIF